MRKTGIVTDSHSGITREEAQQKGIRVIPMPFYMDEHCYYEGIDLTREEFFTKIRESKAVSTSQPSPQTVLEAWDEALKEYEQVLYIPISSGLSGSCSTAMALAQDEPYKGRVFVVDNGRVATLLHQSILDAEAMLARGYDAAKVKFLLEKARDRMVIYIGVDTLEYLKRGGRISASTQLIGNLLNIRPILKFDVGILDTYKNCRGLLKAKHAMIEAMRHDLETTFVEEWRAGRVHLLAATSAGEQETNQWIEEIQRAFPGMEIMCDELSLGVSCHIGPGGLGIGCSCAPE